MIRTKTRPHQIGNLSHDHRRDDKVEVPPIENSNATSVIIVVIINASVERASVNDREHAPTLRSISLRHAQRCPEHHCHRVP